MENVAAQFGLSFLSRFHFECTVGVKTGKVAVSTWSEQIMFLSLEDCRWCYLRRVKFTGCMIPEHPLIYPAWVGERSDSRVGNAALLKRVEFPPTLPWNGKHQTSKKSHMWTCSTTDVSKLNRETNNKLFTVCIYLLFDGFSFFCLVDVKIRHSSLILKEVLLIFTNKPQDGGEGSNV